MSYIKALLQGSVLTVLFVAFFVIAIDALEWETTGKCQDCLLMPYLTERAQQ